MTTLEIPFFDLQQIADSGQCFRMSRLGDGFYSVISDSRYVEIRQNGCLFTFNCPDEDLPFWRHYFDLDADYSRFAATIPKEDLYLQEAAKAGSGIRILHQDPWEMIMTFILSQQKTIPKIREAVEALSCSYGTKITAVLQNWEDGTPDHIASDGHLPCPEKVHYAFPNAEMLSAASLEDLKALKLGYRAKYIHRVCSDCADGHLDLNLLSGFGYEDAMRYLTGFYGIGVKVAGCICLFGLHHVNAFPVDTWIEQILHKHYYKEIYKDLPKNRLYPAMINDNFGKYKGYAGVMQQYIFYYERLCREKIK